jgi:hypothetical protein
MTRLLGLGQVTEQGFRPRRFFQLALFVFALRLG